MGALQGLKRISSFGKILSPSQHALLDYVTIAGFLAAACVTWRKNRRCAMAALANGALMLCHTPFTDFEGSGLKPVNFRLHGALDSLQAGMSAFSPSLWGFAKVCPGAASLFRVQALQRALVLYLTDFEAADTVDQRFRRVA